MGAPARVCLHIGPYKTGTTYLQHILWRNRAALADADVLVPRESWVAQRRAVSQLMKRPAGVPGRRPPRRRRPRDPWDRLLDEVAASGAGTVLLSVERLCLAEPHTVAALVESFAPAQVKVVYAARDLARVVPAEWQTRLRNRWSPTWREFIDSIREPAGVDSHGGSFWRRHDPAQVLPPWLAHIPRDQVHVLTVPPPGRPPELLWDRFCAVLGLEPDRYDLDVPRANMSLGGVESEVLRRLSARVGARLPLPAYVDLVNHFVAREVLERRAQSFRLVLPAAELAWLTPRADAAVGYLRELGLPVEGDLDDLVPVAEPGARTPDDVEEVEVLALVEQVLGAALVELARRQEVGC